MAPHAHTNEREVNVPHTNIYTRYPCNICSTSLQYNSDQEYVTGLTRTYVYSRSEIRRQDNTNEGRRVYKSSNTFRLFTSLTKQQPTTYISFYLATRLILTIRNTTSNMS